MYVLKGYQDIRIMDLEWRFDITLNNGKKYQILRDSLKEKLEEITNSGTKGAKENGNRKNANGNQ